MESKDTCTPSRTLSTLTVFPQSDHFVGSSQRKRAADDNDASNTHKVRFLDHRKRQARLPLAINSSSLFPPRPPPLRDGPIAPTLTPASTSDPANEGQGTSGIHKYRPILEEDQAGACILVHRADPQFKVYALKRRPNEAQALPRIRHTALRGVVNILDSYQEAESLCVIYEYMSVSLAEIQASAAAALKEYEIAAICNEILHGLAEIRGEGLEHHVSCANVLLSLDGEVKIANIADSMLAAESSELSSARSVGQMLVELLEPGMSSCTGQLQEPTHWSESLQHFISHTKIASVDDLLQHDFLRKSPGYSCLIPHVHVCLRSMKKYWRLPEL